MLSLKPYSDNNVVAKSRRCMSIAEEKHRRQLSSLNSLHQLSSLSLQKLSLKCRCIGDILSSNCDDKFKIVVAIQLRHMLWLISTYVVAILVLFCVKNNKSCNYFFKRTLPIIVHYYNQIYRKISTRFFMSNPQFVTLHLIHNTRTHSKFIITKQVQHS